MRYAERTREALGLLLLASACHLIPLQSARAQSPSKTEAPAPVAPTIDAQQEAEANEAFARALQAYDEGEFELALLGFEEAFRLSGKGEIQYNIGLTAQELGEDDKALAAFRAYLELVEEAPREMEAKARVRMLLYKGADPDSSVSVTYKAVDPYQPDAPPKRKRAVVGPVIFMTLGLAGLGAMTAGFIQDGKCLDRDGAGRCTEVKTLNSVPTIVYGSVGGALLLSGAVWIGLSGRNEVQFGLGPGTLQVKGRF